MKMKLIGLKKAARCAYTLPVAFLAVVFAVLLGGVSAHATAWIAASSDDFNDPAAWDTGLVPNSAAIVAVITNSGTINYTTGDSFSFDAINMGVTAANVGRGNNTFNMTDGTLTLTDTGGGNIFSIGGNSSATASTVATTNTFTMSGGTLTASTGNNGNYLIGMAANGIATVNFNGGTVNFNTSGTNAGLYVGGQGVATLNINGATVNIASGNNQAQQGAMTIGQGVTTTGKGAGTVNMIAGILNITNAPIHIGNRGSNNVLNVSGGTINCGSLSFGNGTSSALVTNTFIMSGGTINNGSGFSQNGAANNRIKLFSGGTISTLPTTTTWTWGTTVSPNQLTNSPGPGFLTLAPLAGTTINGPGASPVNFVGPGALVCAGPGTVKLNGPHAFTGGLTNTGGTLEINVAQTADLGGLTVVGGNLQIDVDNALVNSPIAIPGGSSLIFSNTGAAAFTNVITGAANVLVNGGFIR
jgi:hypothetical protein